MDSACEAAQYANDSVSEDWEKVVRKIWVLVLGPVGVFTALVLMGLLEELVAPVLLWINAAYFFVEIAKVSLISLFLSPCGDWLSGTLKSKHPSVLCREDCCRTMSVAHVVTSFFLLCSSLSLVVFGCQSHRNCFCVNNEIFFPICSTVLLKWPLSPHRTTLVKQLFCVSCVRDGGQYLFGLVFPSAGITSVHQGGRILLCILNASLYQA